MSPSIVERIRPRSNVSQGIPEKFRPPSKLLHLTEPLRAAYELGSMPFAEPWLNMQKGGDGHPIMVIPGFTAGDRSTKILRDFLDNQGYSTSCWEQGINFGAREELFDGVVAVLHRLYDEYGCKVSIIGQSLGGIYAREIAKRYPKLVRQVITLGSPFNDPDGHSSQVSDLYKFFNPEKAEKPPEQFRKMEWSTHMAPSMACTAIFSKGDGICHWRSCIQHGGHDKVENIEVMSSHTGMAVNPLVLFVIADRLAQREDKWKAFHVGRYFGASFLDGLNAH